MLHGMGLRAGFGALLLVAVLGAIGCSGADEPSNSDMHPSVAESLGAPCVPGEERVATFSGFNVRDVTVEVDSPDCAKEAVCLVSHFHGRVSCPYGQGAEEASAGTGACFLPYSNEKVTVAVPSQYIARQPDQAVYCSCRCAGPDTNAEYCECTAGFECLELVPDLGLGAEGSGSYCVKKGAEPNDITSISPQTCDTPGRAICGHAQPLPP
jgi:hypothetical protein